jgi:hypothetical protein|tara:strand:+ start:907 stop:1125 length:219 start_codon:yes stop_codon:yes gene_type:complete
MKKRTLNELRQVKTFGYTPPITSKKVEQTYLDACDREFYLKMRIKVLNKQIIKTEKQIDKYKNELKTYEKSI